MEKGTVVRVLKDRGFGFIRAEDGSELFFHHTAVADQKFDALGEGTQVEFEKERDPRGRGSRASNVRLAQ